MRNVKVIFGAPGCGKTTRLMEVLERELAVNDPDQVAFVSFTRKGTYEGAERAKIKFNLGDKDLPYFRTLHSVAFRALKLSRYDMVDKRDYREFSEAMGMKFVGYYTEEFFNNDDRYLFVHFLRRNNARAAEAYALDVDSQVLRDVELNFERFKKHKRVFDFTDVIEDFIERGEPLPVKVAIIDEAQDLTTLQWEMCDVAFKRCERVYVAGDDDQAIYEWSGADVRRFLSLKGEREVLGQSYRLPRDVLLASRRVSSMIADRVDKEFEAHGEEGQVTMHNSLDEVKVDPSETWYFLSRNNCFLARYEEMLKRRALVYVKKGITSFDPRQVEAINSFEAARRRGALTEVDEVKLKLHARGELDLTKPWYDNMNFDNDATAYYKDLIRCKTDLKCRSLTVSTIHGVKGGEADNVVLLLDFTRSVMVNMEKNPDSELRCLYVAMTRAKKHLHLVHAESMNGYDDYANMEAL